MSYALASKSDDVMHPYIAIALKHPRETRFLRAELSLNPLSRGGFENRRSPVMVIFHVVKPLLNAASSFGCEQRIFVAAEHLAAR